MRRPGGYSIITDPALNSPLEADTFTCAHCNSIVTVKPRCDPAEMGGRCYVCDALVCQDCAQKRVCDPLEEKLKRAEASYHARRSYEAAG